MIRPQSRRCRCRAGRPIRPGEAASARIILLQHYGPRRDPDRGRIRGLRASRNRAGSLRLSVTGAGISSHTIFQLCPSGLLLANRPAWDGSRRRPQGRSGPALSARRKRDSQPCIARPLANGRCRLHGGMSTGPPPVGRARAIANLRQSRALSSRRCPTTQRSDGDQPASTRGTALPLIA
jgi:hypothetical protein